MPHADDLVALLAVNRHRFRPVIPFDLRTGGAVVFDFTDSSPDFAQIDINDVAGFTERLFGRIGDAELPVGVGRYAEDRMIYRHSPLFDGEQERRSVHLGVDLFVVEGTEVVAPLDARVHSVADNAGLGDYGPTVILEHELDGRRFWTLYGHLGRELVDRLEIGRELVGGESFAAVGAVEENGGWPPHLHFQLIADLLGRSGDFPGVAAPSERQRWLALCPDPNIILGIPEL
ncbi:MAG: peptidoglycan DD-metalloendopeptidase family protein [Holophagae bacterium]